MAVFVGCEAPRGSGLGLFGVIKAGRLLCASAFLILACMGLPMQSLAQEAPTDYVGSFHVWVLGCNTHGYQLKSKYPMAWYDRNHRYQEKRVTLYLGDSCDASSPSFGKGKWNWANGGFVVELENRRFGFARQELICGKKRLPDGCRF